MKNIKLKFIDAGINDSFQYNIKVFDINNNLLYEGNTYNGEICFNLKKHSCYRIIAKSKQNILCKSIYISPYSNTIFLWNETFKNKPKPVTFTLTDANYNNLCISKGEIILNEQRI